MEGWSMGKLPHCPAPHHPSPLPSVSEGLGASMTPIWTEASLLSVYPLSPAFRLFCLEEVASVWAWLCHWLLCNSG